MSGTTIAIVSAGGAVLGAVGGGLITGLVAIRNTKIQVRAQQQSEEAARKNERLVQHLDFRRTAYTELLNRVTELLEAISYLRSSQVSESKESAQKVTELGLSLVRRTSVVFSEGPPELATLALKLCTDGLSLSRTLVQASESFDESDTEQTINELVEGQAEHAFETVTNSNADFIVKARQVLGGEF